MDAAGGCARCDGNGSRRGSGRERRRQRSRATGERIDRIVAVIGA